MKIKIEINDISSESDKDTTPLQRNKFEEIVLFLDCPTIQNIITKFRKRIGLQHMVPYESFDEWKEHGILQDELSKEEVVFLYQLNSDIDYLSNVTFELTKERKEELDQKKEGRIKWDNPYYTFSKALERRLKSLGKDKLLQIALKAVVCGEVRNNDLADHLVERKGARSAIFGDREYYFLYKTQHPKTGIKMGYGSIAKVYKTTLQTVRSGITSYKNKLKDYELILKATQ